MPERAAPHGIDARPAVILEQKRPDDEDERQMGVVEYRDQRVDEFGLRSGGTEVVRWY